MAGIKLLLLITRFISSIFRVSHYTIGFILSPTFNFFTNLIKHFEITNKLLNLYKIKTKERKWKQKY